MVVLTIRCWDVTLNLCIRGAMKLNTNRIGLFVFVSSGLTKVALYVGIDMVILA